MRLTVKRSSTKGLPSFVPEQTQVLNSVISVLLRQETVTWGGLELVSAGVWEGDYGWGSGYAALLAHAELCTVRNLAQ